MVALAPGVEKYLFVIINTVLALEKNGESAQSFSLISCTNNTNKNKESS